MRYVPYRTSLGPADHCVPCAGRVRRPAAEVEHGPLHRVGRVSDGPRDGPRTEEDQAADGRVSPAAPLHRFDKQLRYRRLRRPRRHRERLALLDPRQAHEGTLFQHRCVSRHCSKSLPTRMPETAAFEVGLATVKRCRSSHNWHLF